MTRAAKTDPNPSTCQRPGRRDAADATWRHGRRHDWRVCRSGMPALLLAAIFVTLPARSHAASPVPDAPAAAPAAAARTAPAVPAASFWTAFAGSWTGEASYLDERLQPIVANYATLARVELADDGVVITEWKFYPDGELARGMSGGKLPAGRGLETVTVSRGRADPAQREAVQFGADRGRWVATTPELASGMIAGKAGAPRYRFIAALSGPEHAEISTFGYHDDGSFKGLALFRMRRIGAAEESAQLDALRARFAVGHVMDSRPR